MNTKDFKALLATSPKTFVKVFGDRHNTLHVGVGAGVAADTLDKGKRALKQGHRVQWADGSQQWQTTATVLDSSKQGSAQYTWDKSGNKVKHNVFLVTKLPNGDVTKDLVRTTWRNF